MPAGSSRLHAAVHRKSWAIWLAIVVGTASLPRTWSPSWIGGRSYAVQPSNFRTRLYQAQNSCEDDVTLEETSTTSPEQFMVQFRGLVKQLEFHDPKDSNFPGQLLRSDAKFQDGAVGDAPLHYVVLTSPDGTTPLGWATFKELPDFWRLSWIWVPSKFQRRGVASRMIRYIESATQYPFQIGKRNVPTEFSLLSGLDHKIYEKNGFVALEEVSTFASPTERQLWLSGQANVFSKTATYNRDLQHIHSQAKFCRNGGKGDKDFFAHILPLDPKPIRPVSQIAAQPKIDPFAGLLPLDSVADQPARPRVAASSHNDRPGKLASEPTLTAAKSSPATPEIVSPPSSDVVAPVPSTTTTSAAVLRDAPVLIPDTAAAPAPHPLIGTPAVRGAAAAFRVAAASEATFAEDPRSKPRAAPRPRARDTVVSI